MELLAPESYRNATPQEIAEHTNGCGPEAWLPEIVNRFNSLDGLDVSGPCRIHDWMYGTGGSEEYRREADVTLYLNLAQVVLLEGGPLAPVRMAGVASFYMAVRACGAEHFRKG